MRVAIGITTYRNPGELRKLLDNMLWAGLPDIPVYVFQDPSPFGDEEAITEEYRKVIRKYRWITAAYTAHEWGCMHGAAEEMMRWTDEDWVIYVPDDVAFTRGGLWNEYAGVLTYGRKWVGGLQAPYWNLRDITPGKDRQTIWDPTYLKEIPRNPHWDGEGVPRKYVNLNGAGFSISRQLWRDMNGWPRVTWRLDEYAGYMAWKLGYAIFTLPGPPRVHIMRGSGWQLPEDMPAYSTEDAWAKATGKTVAESHQEIREQMARTPGGMDGCFDDYIGRL